MKSMIKIALVSACILSFQSANLVAYGLDKTFLQTAHTFIEDCDKHMHNAAWLNKQESADQNGTIVASHFVQKLELPNTAEVKFVTDLHGEAQTLQDWIEQLQHDGWLDAENPYKIAKPNGYLIFLGDYVDRGPDSTQTLISAMKLYINNPDHVIMIKGNHEDKSIYMSYGFGQEVDHDETILATADAVFNRLPSACYLTWQDATCKKQSILCTHGGPNLGYNPQTLLASTKNHEWVHTSPQQFHQLLQNDCLYNYLQKYLTENPGADLFAWTDFNTHQRIGSPSFDGGRLGLCLNTLLDYYAKTGVPAIEQKGIIRGHQHGDMRKKLAANNGIYILDSDDQFTNPDKKITLSTLTKNAQPFVITVGPGTSRVALSLQLDKDTNKCSLSRQTIIGYNTNK